MCSAPLHADVCGAPTEARPVSLHMGLSWLLPLLLAAQRWIFNQFSRLLNNSLQPVQMSKLDCRPSILKQWLPRTLKPKRKTCLGHLIILLKGSHSHHKSFTAMWMGAKSDNRHTISQYKPIARNKCLPLSHTTRKFTKQSYCTNTYFHP